MRKNTRQTNQKTNTIQTQQGTKKTYCKIRRNAYCRNAHPRNTCQSPAMGWFYSNTNIHALAPAIPLRKLALRHHSPIQTTGSNHPGNDSKNNSSLSKIHTLRHPHRIRRNDRNQIHTPKRMHHRNRISRKPRRIPILRLRHAPPIRSRTMEINTHKKRRRPRTIPLRHRPRRTRLIHMHGINSQRNRKLLPPTILSCKKQRIRPTRRIRAMVRNRNVRLLQKRKQRRNTPRQKRTTDIKT